MVTSKRFLSFCVATLCLLTTVAVSRNADAQWRGDSAAVGGPTPPPAPVEPALVVLGTLGGATAGQFVGLFGGALLGVSTCGRSSSGDEGFDCLGSVAVGAGLGMVASGIFLTPAMPYWIDGERGSYWAAVGGAAIGGIAPLLIAATLVGSGSRGADDIAGALAIAAWPGHVAGALIGYYLTVPDEPNRSRRNVGDASRTDWAVLPAFSQESGGLQLVGAF